jgi:hypothetical protein
MPGRCSAVSRRRDTARLTGSSGTGRRIFTRSPRIRRGLCRRIFCMRGCSRRSRLIVERCGCLPAFPPRWRLRRVGVPRVVASARLGANFFPPRWGGVGVRLRRSAKDSRNQEEWRAHAEPRRRRDGFWGATMRVRTHQRRRRRGSACGAATFLQTWLRDMALKGGRERFLKNLGGSCTIFQTPLPMMAGVMNDLPGGWNPRSAKRATPRKPINPIRDLK